MNLFSRFFARIRFRNHIKKDESANVVDSMVKARKLYKQLSVAAHPDKITIAEDLMQRITANRHNYSELLRLKDEVDEKLK